MIFVIYHVIFIPLYAVTVLTEYLALVYVIKYLHLFLVSKFTKSTRSELEAEEGSFLVFKERWYLIAASHAIVGLVGIVLYWFASNWPRWSGPPTRPWLLECFASVWWFPFSLLPSEIAKDPQPAPLRSGDGLLYLLPFPFVIKNLLIFTPYSVLLGYAMSHFTLALPELYREPGTDQDTEKNTSGVAIKTLLILLILVGSAVTALVIKEMIRLRYW